MRSLLCGVEKITAVINITAPLPYPKLQRLAGICHLPVPPTAQEWVGWGTARKSKDYYPHFPGKAKKDYYPHFPDEETEARDGKGPAHDGTAEQRSWDLKGS